MTRQEMLFTIAAEECAELAQRCTKVLRFGLTETQPGQERNNKERLEAEFIDLLGTLSMLGIFPPSPDDHIAWSELILVRRNRVEKYLAYSKEMGTLHD